MSAPTLHEALRDIGMDSRRTPKTVNTGRREVYRVHSQEIVGEYDAWEAWEILIDGEPQFQNQ